MQILTN